MGGQRQEDSADITNWRRGVGACHSSNTTNRTPQLHSASGCVGRVVEQIIDANRANRAKGPAGNHGSRLRAELAKRGQRLPLLGDDNVTADRNYIKEFILTRHRALGQKHGVRYAEAFHHIGGSSRNSAIEEYIKKNAVPLK